MIANPFKKRSVSLSYFHVLPDRLPNGNLRATGLIAEAAVIIGGDFVCKARIVKLEDGIEAVILSDTAVDTQRQRVEQFPFSERVRQDVSALLLCQLETHRARHYGRNEGKN